MVGKQNLRLASLLIELDIEAFNIAVDQTCLYYLVVAPMQGSLGKLTSETRGLKYLAIFFPDDLFSEALNPQISQNR